MELSIDLAVQIASMVVICIVGYFMCRFHVVTATECRIFSVLAMYVFAPAAIIQAFQSELNHDQISGFALAMVAALLIHGLMIVIALLLRKSPLKLTREEAASSIYSNCGNLGIPLISGIATLGPSYVFYISPFIAVQTILVWSHGQALMGSEGKLDVKRVLTNPCIITPLLGLIIFFCQIKFPAPLQTAIESSAACLGPCCMLVIGMSLGESDLLAVFRNKRVYLAVFIRLIAFPLLSLLVLLPLQHIWTHPDLNNIFIVMFLCATGPAASTVPQMAQLYKNPHIAHASAINVVSTLLCVVTMPAMILLFQYIIGME